MATKEANDSNSGSRRRVSAPKSGSVWESRMKLDDVKGGIKVFYATHHTSEQNDEPQLDKNVTTPKQSTIEVSGKRKTWKSESSESSPLQIARQGSEMTENLDEKYTGLSVSVDRMKKPPAPIRKTRSVSRYSDGSEKNSVQLRKLKSVSDPITNIDAPSNGNLKKLVVKNSDESVAEIQKSRSDDEFGMCKEKNITSDLKNVGGQIKIQFDDNVVVNGEEEEKDKEIEVAIEKKSADIKETIVQDQKPNKIVTEKKKWINSNERPAPFSSSVKSQAPPVVSHARIHPTPAKSKPCSEHFHGSPRTHGKLQTFVDLVMWRDTSRSAFVFGIGTFLIISSSFTRDLNISFISVLAYLGLVYLAAIFLFRTLINRGSMDPGKTEQDYVVGEDETLWLIKLVLPYVNEFLLNLRALFSGDPATTMKLAVLLFALARCGGSITIWKMAKLGFFGVFTVPKICSSYSSKLTAYGKFWIQRFGDAWESCSHKKAVGFAIFTLVWNLSSVVARIWAAFMLFVAFKYYQQSMIKEERAREEATTEDSCWRAGKHRTTTTSTEIQKQKKPC